MDRRSRNRFESLVEYRDSRKDRLDRLGHYFTHLVHLADRFGRRGHLDSLFHQTCYFTFVVLVAYHYY